MRLLNQYNYWLIDVMIKKDPINPVFIRNKQIDRVDSYKYFDIQATFVTFHMPCFLRWEILWVVQFKHHISFRDLNNERD